ncbi:type IV toxin-antitoxin system AbiEi family antitoxin [Micromonospora zamorensis]|uniref:type IV toxin-antitoxin system AbiEi family antitoxin n=1 Tax=Micromonospora zamorensis TaxID=709883 RepID=UPI0037BAED10
MPVSPRRPASLQGRVFRGSRVVAQGLLTRTELRSRAWRPLFRDVYADARLEVTHRTRCAAAVRWVLPPGVVIAGRSAAALYGAASVADHEPLDVLVPAAQRFGPVSGLVVHASEIPATDVAIRQGIPLTTPTRTCWDLAQWLPTEEAVAIVDRLASQRLVVIPELHAGSRSRAGNRGWRRMMRVAELADAGAESAPESRLRVRIVLAGVQAPVTQFVVERDGRFVARLDLAWPHLKVAVEYDGLWHDDPEQFHRDRRRLNRLLGEDWIVLHVTAKRFREDFDGFLAELRQVLRSRSR